MNAPNERHWQAQAGLAQRLLACRQRSVALAAGLSDADLTAQSMDDASPGKWHLAHTTWFHEAFVLPRFMPGFKPWHAGFGFLFNSYYDGIGERHPRPRRGLLTRPALHEVLAWRAAVDDALGTLLAHETSPELAALVELGIQHEQQHQELFLTDLLHLFAQNPLKPVCRSQPAPEVAAGDDAAGWVRFDGGRIAVGHAGSGFAFDCEGPRHEVLLRPYALARRLVCNGEWLQFMADGGYRQPLLWLADGWARVQSEGWCAPLYWRGGPGGFTQMTLAGEQPVDPRAPVCHISHYEADAFARWAGKRLPTEAEWEAAAAAQPVAGHFADADVWRPLSAALDAQAPLRQLYGTVWEWTASAFTAYPGFRPAPGAVGEYNGKFMSGQMVLRGGSCATPAGHVRASYRNFFQPQQRWQFGGLRLAEDLA